MFVDASHCATEWNLLTQFLDWQKFFFKWQQNQQSTMQCLKVMLKMRPQWQMWKPKMWHVHVLGSSTFVLTCIGTRKKNIKTSLKGEMSRKKEWKVHQKNSFSFLVLSWLLAFITSCSFFGHLNIHNCKRAQHKVSVMIKIAAHHIVNDIKI